jgi:hypothetical protein
VNLSLGLGHLLAPVLAVGSAVAAWSNRARWVGGGARRDQSGQDVGVSSTGRERRQPNGQTEES